ncbi:hypothetical protein C8R43DRAFT_622464 [Mycena crocata]|nr:hypothetical protein C8R43DRAFT_622464 [Mycena crocata]
MSPSRQHPPRVRTAFVLCLVGAGLGASRTVSHLVPPRVKTRPVLPLDPAPTRSLPHTLGHILRLPPSLRDVALNLTLHLQLRQPPDRALPRSCYRPRPCPPFVPSRAHILTAMLSPWLASIFTPPPPCLPIYATFHMCSLPTVTRPSVPRVFARVAPFTPSARNPLAQTCHMPPNPSVVRSAS